MSTKGPSECSDTGRLSTSSVQRLRFEEGLDPFPPCKAHGQGCECNARLSWLRENPFDTWPPRLALRERAL